MVHSFIVRRGSVIFGKAAAVDFAAIRTSRGSGPFKKARNKK
jgi:hypothetical protein